MCLCGHRSAGLTVDGGATGNSNVPRQVTCPPGETAISDMALNSTGEIMYSAAGNTVRIWDLRSYALFWLFLNAITLAVDLQLLCQCNDWSV